MRRTYRGDAIEVSFDLDLCTHIGECLRRQPEVFELRRRPWIVPDAASADEIAAVVERCPSGALQYRRLDGGAEELGPEPAVVTPMRNGPLLVRGRVEVRREDGTLEVLGFRAPGDVFHIELSPVRLQRAFPMSKADDPRE